MRKKRSSRRRRLRQERRSGSNLRTRPFDPKREFVRRRTAFDLRRASLDDPNRPLAWIPGAKMRPSRGLKQSSILVLSPLSPRAPAHHVDIE